MCLNIYASNLPYNLLYKNKKKNKQTYFATQPIYVQASYIDSIDGNRATFNFIKSQQQRNSGAFAAARRSN